MLSNGSLVRSKLPINSNLGRFPGQNVKVPATLCSGLEGEYQYPFKEKALLIVTFGFTITRTVNRLWVFLNDFSLVTNVIFEFIKEIAKEFYYVIFLLISVSRLVEATHRREYLGN